MSKESLYQISSDLLTVIEGGVVFDEETGEIFFDESNINELSCSMAKKGEAVGLYAEGRRALAKARREAAKKMTESASLLEAEADRLDKYALKCVKAVGGVVETDLATIKVRKCPAHVEVLEESKVPEAYWTTKTTRSLNKNLIKSTIKDGGSVAGCALVQDERIEVK